MTDPDVTVPLSTGDDVGDGADERSAETVRRALRRRRRAVKRREVRTAMDRLEARGQLTARQRRTVERMATAIVEEVLSPSEAALVDESRRTEEVVATVVKLFDLDSPG
ncbi:hypothetical protein [Candidatus Halobonum tyrrellensis]|uniref:hypothetical protein n=1 Tax=Candidatus Halobonum tyrrellensis TaxID=1431545 RepID=UPI0013779A89|nr:hypothetical protein [Candidatus Halobonum tyrrellensis]